MNIKIKLPARPDCLAFYRGRRSFVPPISKVIVDATEITPKPKPLPSTTEGGSGVSQDPQSCDNPVVTELTKAA
jgi:hypothetical protein